MTLSLMIYGLVLGSILAGAAHFLDLGFRALGRPTRWIWGLGLAAAASAPLLAPFAGGKPSSTAQGGSISAEFLYEMVSGGPVETQGLSGLSLALEKPLVLLWILSSILILLAVLWTSLRLGRAAKGWKNQKVGAEEVLVSAGLGPAVLGVFRPRIVLPPWVLKLGQEKLEMILLHEKEHQKARDPALLTLGLLLAAVTPWNPSLWWMVRRLHLAVEGDCDRRVLARGIPPKSYGNLLLEVASGARGFSILAPALAEGGNTFLERRLLMIRSTVRKHRFGAAALATLASGGLLVLACETPTPPTPMEDEITLEAPPVAMDLAQTELAEVEEGYHLVRKTAEGVEYVLSVSPEKVKLIQEDPEVALDGKVFRVKELTGVELRRKEEVAGTSDTAELKPLIIVDGVIMSDPDALANLSSDDIKSIEIMKGNAARALYGERAAGGVIMVTTKR